MILSLLLGAALAVDPPAVPSQIDSPGWGTIALDANHPGTYHCVVKAWPESGKLTLPEKLRGSIGGEWSGDGRGPLIIDDEPGSDRQTVLPPPGKREAGTGFRLETAEKSQQFADGRIVFHPLDAKVVGQKARLEKELGPPYIGYWTDVQDYVTWDYGATRWGRYRVLASYATGAEGVEMEVEFGGQKLKGEWPTTGFFYRFATIDLGTIYLARAEKTSLTIRCTKLGTGMSAVNLRGITLLPACEGKPPVQADDGLITLNSRDAIVEGMVLRYEPAPNKLTLGYWVKPSDAALWRFTAKQPGEYDLEVLQGCGTGQGGSAVQVTVAGQALSFVVEETGHFQNFKPRVIGRVKLEKPGEYELRIQPQKIAKAAALDVREVRLKPVGR